MVKTTDHSKLIAAAARNVLGPIGLFQKGRSRTWLDDHGWWICVVEFQPSSWSRGSYLNVGCTWLWHVNDCLSFDEGGRVEPFSRFRDESQCELVANSLAEQAANEIIRYRKLFPNVHQVCAHYLQRWPDGFWPSFHAAVACALAGEADQARRLFKQVTDSKEDSRDWVISAQADATQLSLIANDIEHIRHVVTERVQKSRELQKLPALASLDFDR